VLILVVGLAWVSELCRLSESDDGCSPVAGVWRVQSSPHRPLACWQRRAMPLPAMAINDHRFNAPARPESRAPRPTTGSPSRALRGPSTPAAAFDP
jgi:hypothetical protein